MKWKNLQPYVQLSFLLLKFYSCRLRSLFPKKIIADRTSGNAMFRRSQLSSFALEKSDLETFDLYLYKTMNDSRLLGQIIFEYGNLLHGFRNWKGARVLDIGSGRSTFPYWLSAKGANVTSFELPRQTEAKLHTLQSRFMKHLSPRQVYTNVTEVFGDMRCLPFSDNTFDVVTSFSVMEHLDTDPRDLSYVPYDDQKKYALQTLDEMVRVTKKGGVIYITSECCDYTNAKLDAWQKHYLFKNGPDLSSAWRAEEVPIIFYDYLQKKGCEMVGGQSYTASDLNKGKDFWTFRGPYFSAFSVFVKKIR